MRTFLWSIRKKWKKGENTEDSATIADNNSNTRGHGNTTCRQHNGLPNLEVYRTGALGTGDTGVCDQWGNDNEQQISKNKKGPQESARKHWTPRKIIRSGSNTKGKTRASLETIKCYSDEGEMIQSKGWRKMNDRRKGGRKYGVTETKHNTGMELYGK